MSFTKTYPLNGYQVSDNKFRLGWMDNYEMITSMRLIFKSEGERTINLSINEFSLQTITTSDVSVPVFTMFNEIPAYSICFNYIVSFYCDISTIEKNTILEITGTPKISIINNYATLPVVNVPFNNEAKTMVITSGIVNIVDNVDITDLSI